jgi:hypothetical protein
MDVILSLGVMLSPHSVMPSLSCTSDSNRDIDSNSTCTLQELMETYIHTHTYVLKYNTYVHIGAGAVADAAAP